MSFSCSCKNSLLKKIRENPWGKKFALSAKSALYFLINSFIFLYIFFCLEAKVQDRETSAKNNSCSLKILKLARIYFFCFVSVAVTRFGQ
ncbi:hypothetical protein AU378_17635 [Chryseobacterium kwangjuense]|uniref:Uncharacterized protein n=1 Tax=Chryseobacterium kwangjuense TaxID=267125 RepID=A0A135W9F6_9FLAO|nr:hypothetical protein AU378_17635 [Chryseobacterium kwangjuense]